MSGINSKLHAVCDGEGKPIILLLSGEQMSDHKGVHPVLSAADSFGQIQPSIA